MRTYIASLLATTALACTPAAATVTQLWVLAPTSAYTPGAAQTLAGFNYNCGTPISMSGSTVVTPPSQCSPFVELQVAGSPVANGNPIPVAIVSGGGGGGGGGTVTQGTGSSSNPWWMNLGTTDAANLAIISTAQGSGATGVTPPAGGAGLLGWLSGIYSRLGSLSVAQGPQGSSGSPWFVTCVSGCSSTGNPNFGSALPSSGVAIGYSYGGNLVAAPGTANGLKVDGSAVTQPISAASLPLPANAAQDGTDNSGVSQPSSGTGIRGWLSAIYSKLAGTLTITGTVAVSNTNTNGQKTSANSGPVVIASDQSTIPTIIKNGSIGVDYSANKPTLPNVGANFAASGPYASYYLIATVPASATRNSVTVENTSGAQIAIALDDGTAAGGAAPANASAFALVGGSAAGAQGGSWSSSTFKGRVQVYAPLSTASVAVFGD